MECAADYIDILGNCEQCPVSSMGKVCNLSGFCTVVNGTTPACTCVRGWTGTVCNTCDLGFAGPLCLECPGKKLCTLVEFILTSTSWSCSNNCNYLFVCLSVTLLYPRIIYIRIFGFNRESKSLFVFLIDQVEIWCRHTCHFIMSTYTPYAVFACLGTGD